MRRESDVNEFPEVNSKLKMILFCIERYIYKRDPCMLHTYMLKSFTLQYDLYFIDFKYPVRLMCVASVVIIGLLVV